MVKESLSYLSRKAVLEKHNLIFLLTVYFFFEFPLMSAKLNGIQSWHSHIHPTSANTSGKCGSGWWSRQNFSHTIMFFSLFSTLLPLP